MSDSPNTAGESCVRILSLDGGGVRGVLTARILQKMEDYLNAKDGKDLSLGQRFDLIAGTSVGVILGLSLAMGKRAGEIVAHWVEGKNETPDKASPSEEEKLTTGNKNAPEPRPGKIEHIFGHPQPWRRWLFLTPRHDSEALKDALTEWFGETRLSDLDPSCNGPHVLANSTALAKPSLRTCKSPWANRLDPRADKKLADVAYASAAPHVLPSDDGPEVRFPQCRWWALRQQPGGSSNRRSAPDGTWPRPNPVGFGRHR